MAHLGSSLPTGHHPPLMVEIRKDYVDAFVFNPQKILNWNLDVVKCDTGKIRS
jgi:hypothetical protein